MGKFKINDRHVAFCNAIASGMDNYKAYQEYMSPGKKAGKNTASVNANALIKRPAIQELIEQARKARAEAITGEMTRVLAPEFSTLILLPEELDAFHSAIVQGKALVEEVVPVYKWTETFDKNGNLIERKKEANFVSVKRPPNVREKQISIDALYKRGGHYPAIRLFGAFKNLGNDDVPEELVERVVLLSNGEKIPLM
jgi:hypothetical protein